MEEKKGKKRLKKRCEIIKNVPERKNVENKTSPYVSQCFCTVIFVRPSVFICNLTLKILSD